MNNRTTIFWRNLIWTLGLYTGIFVIQFIVIYYRSIEIDPSTALLNWDAAHYYDLMRTGYHDSNVAFFPLFPFFWKATQLSIIGMAIFNGILYCISFSWLATAFDFNRMSLLIIGSVPSLLFMFLPFSEAAFFFAATVLLTGLKKGNNYLTLTGLFLAGLARPVATVFIPTILVVNILIYNAEKPLKKIPYSQLLVSVVSILFVFLLQYAQTGQWLSFFEYQRNWGNYFRMPDFPLNSWAGGYIVRYDAIAFFCGIFAFCWLASIAVKILFRQTKFDNKALLFSLGYLGLLSFTVLFTKGGVFNSFNRYCFASPFFAVALHHVLEQFHFKWKNLLLLFIFSSLFWFFFSSYVHIQTFLKFELLTLYLCLLYLVTNRSTGRMNQFSSLGVMAINVFFFVALMYRFLTGGWVG